jgi:hypothetical protein
MSVPIAEDFDDIAARLKQLEAEKPKAQPEQKPEERPAYGGGMFLGDYDPA